MSRSKANLRILSTADDDAAVWTGLFNRLPPQFQDVHFSVDYGRAYERSYGQQVLLAAYGDSDSYLLMPFLLRDVGRLPWMSNAAIEGPVYDISSLYAFGGPVARVRDEQADRRLHADFHQAFTQYCLSNRIATQFVAFHPLLENHKGLQETGLVEVKARKPVVWIDLTADAANLFRNLPRNHRRSIAKARRLGVRTGVQPCDPPAADTFKELYLAKMQALAADERWLLPHSYCEDFSQCLGPRRISLFNATREGETLASALTLRSGEIAHHHLIGARGDALRLCAHHLLLHDLALWARAQGCKQLLLGGGVEPDDGVFRFKARFSSRRSWFFTANIIYDESLYWRLCDARDSWDPPDAGAQRSHEFFPAYRR
jgi:hypothetical protein